jgi:mannosyltransferase
VVTSEKARRPYPPTPALLLTGLILLALALRFWRLGRWGFDSDEIFMLRDSVNLSAGNPRPLMYLLNHYLVLPFIPLDEYSLRLLPALFGVLAIPVFYVVARHLFGTRAALFGGLLLAVSGLHIYYSHFARYWTLVFLLCTVYPFAIYLGLRERSPRTLLVGLIVAVFAVLAHPASVLLLGGLGIWIVATYFRRDQLVRLWHSRNFRWGALAIVVIVAAVALRFGPMLQGWVSERDRVPRGEFLLHFPVTQGVKQIGYMLAFVESLTVPLVLTSAVGIYSLWQGRDRSLALLMTCMFCFPLAFLVLLSFRSPVSTFYLVPTTPVLFMGAGVFLDRVAGINWDLRPRWLLPATVVAVMMVAGAPTLISQYRDGRRYDFRGAARWLHEHSEPGDVIYSDQPQVMGYYLPGVKVNQLVADPPVLMQSLRTLNQSGHVGSLWIVSPYSSQGSHRTHPKIAILKAWIYGNCQLRNAVGVARLDFRVNELEIFQCPAALPEAAGAQPAKSSTTLDISLLRLPQ